MFAGLKIYLIQGYIRKFYMEVIIEMEKPGKYFFFFFYLNYMGINVWYGLLG